MGDETAPIQAFPGCFRAGHGGASDLGMRWFLGVCALGTLALLHGGIASTRAARAPRAELALPASVVIFEGPEPALKDYSPDESAARELETPETAPLSDRELSLRPSLAMIGEPSVARGMLVDEAGAPISTAEIYGMMWRRGMCSGALMGVHGYARDGVFVFRYYGRPQPEITFWVEAPGFAHKVFELDEEVARALQRGETVDDMRVVLPRAAIIEGTVYGPDGEPVAGATVGVVDDPFARWDRYLTCTTTGAGGRFRLVDVDPTNRLWLHANEDMLLARPAPLGNLIAAAVVQLDVRLERVRWLDV